MNHPASFFQEIRVWTANRLQQIARAPGWLAILSWGLGQALVLSVLHHLANFWEWATGAQLVVGGLTGLVLGLVIHGAVMSASQGLRTIKVRRWLAMGVPAAAISVLLGLQLLRLPEAAHHLTITPRLATPQTVVQIREIRAAFGAVLDLTEFQSEAGWQIRDSLLVASGAQPAALEAWLWGPVGEQVRVSFIAADGGGGAEVKVDGHAVTIYPAGPAGNETRARLDTQYRWGALNFAFIPFLVLVDVLAALSILTALWITQEMHLLRRPTIEPAADVGLRLHAWSLGFVLLVGLLLHSWNFLSDPLRVTKDGPSYLQGAVHLAQYGNFDGAASYRGPGTTFLFAPAITVLGRNPLGVKLTQHLAALGCVPLAYAIAWLLTNRRWVAIASGLGTAFSPDLYAYANDVLSEVPHIFALLLLGATLLHAMRRRTFAATLACLLAGAWAVLVRPDNAVALVIAIVLLIISISGSRADITHRTDHAPTRRVGLRNLLVAVLIASLPLLAWSAHNLRVHRFFGISDYIGEVLYDGWIYYGENSNIRILDRESAAVRQIDAAIPLIIRDDAAPTGWDVHAALLAEGVSQDEAFSLLRQATLDSIRRHPDRALKILRLKLQDAPVPLATLPVSLEGSTGANPYVALTREYFDAEPWLLLDPGGGARGRDALQLVYGPFYLAWLGFGLLSMWLGIYREPKLLWIGFVVLTANALLLPILVGVASWRYLIPGIILMGPIAFAAIDTLLGLDSAAVRRVIRRARG